MRDFDGLRDLLELETLSLCYLFEIELKSGTTYYYTDSSESILVNGTLYRADAGIDMSAIRDTMNAYNQTATIEIGYRSDLITEEMVRRGDLDEAKHSVKILDYREMVSAEVFSGMVDRVTASNKYSVTVDLTGWQTKSTQTNGVYSLKCRNVFCDKGCTLNIEDYSFPFVVSGAPGQNVPDPLLIGTTVSLPEGFFQYGSVKWTSGRNIGNLTGIAYSADGMIALTTAPPYVPQGGDEGIARAGCDFYAETCTLKYDNLRNLEAEPAVPKGTDTSAAKTETSTTQDPAIPGKREEPVYSAASSFAPMAYSAG